MLSPHSAPTRLRTESFHLRWACSQARFEIVISSGSGGGLSKPGTRCVACRYSGDRSTMATASRLLSLLLRTFSPTSPRDNVPNFAMGCPCGSAKLSRTTRSAITYVAAVAPAGHRLSPKWRKRVGNLEAELRLTRYIARGMAAQHARSTSKLNLH